MADKIDSLNGAMARVSVPTHRDPDTGHWQGSISSMDGRRAYVIAFMREIGVNLDRLAELFPEMTAAIRVVEEKGKTEEAKEEAKEEEKGKTKKAGGVR